MVAKFEKNKFISAGLLSIISVILLIFPVTSFYFGHIHILPNGEAICHSHVLPYSTGKQDESSHSHTNKELLFLQFVNSIVKFALALFPLILFFSFEAFSFLILKTALSKTNRFPSFSLRAPPKLI